MRVKHSFVAALAVALVGIITSGCGLVGKTVSQKLSSDTTVVLYRQTIITDIDGDSAWYIFLPKLYAVSEDQGPDFSVYHYVYRGADSSGYMGSAGFYSGFAASRFGAEGFRADPAGTVVLDLPRPGTTWQLYHNKTDWMAETLEGQHMWAEAPTRRLLDRWFEIFKTEYRSRK